MMLADLTLREGNAPLAHTLFRKCLDSSWGKDNDTQSFVLERLADIGRWGAIDAEMLFIWPMVYLGYAFKSKGKLELQKALLFVGDVFISNQEEDTAHSLWAVALEGFTHMDVHRSRAQCMLRLGDLARKRGNFTEAIGFWMAARPLFERSLQAKDVGQIDVRVAAVGQAHQKTLQHLNALHATERAMIEELGDIHSRRDAVAAAGMDD